MRALVAFSCVMSRTVWAAPITPPSADRIGAAATEPPPASRRGAAGRSRTRPPIGLRRRGAATPLPRAGGRPASAARVSPLDRLRLSSRRSSPRRHPSRVIRPSRPQPMMASLSWSRWPPAVSVAHFAQLAALGQLADEGQQRQPAGATVATIRNTAQGAAKVELLQEQRLGHHVHLPGPPVERQRQHAPEPAGRGRLLGRHEEAIGLAPSVASARLMANCPLEVEILQHLGEARPACRSSRWSRRALRAGSRPAIALLQRARVALRPGRPAAAAAPSAAHRRGLHQRDRRRHRRSRRPSWRARRPRGGAARAEVEPDRGNGGIGGPRSTG